MADRTASPFAGLDRALLRSTTMEARGDETAKEPPQGPPAAAEPLRAATPPPVPNVPHDARVHARARPPVPPRTPAPTHEASSANLVETLFRALHAKQHLVSSTFRFQGQELAELDGIASVIAERTGRRVSKNDLVRLGLTWLLLDYRRGNESVLAQALERL